MEGIVSNGGLWYRLSWNFGFCKQILIISKLDRRRKGFERWIAGTGSESHPVAARGLSDVETSGSARELNSY
jgi:hypothetical protein